MNKNLLFIGILSMSLFSFGQVKKTSSKPTVVTECTHFAKTKPLRDIYALPADVPEKDYTVPNKLRRYKHINPNGLPKGNDPVWQLQKSSHYNKAPIQNWDGTAFSAYPPDPSGAAGPNHYIHMVNSNYTIYDKQGNVLYGPASLNSLLGNGGGDPIVMYDKDADRWFMSQFSQTNNQLLVAISQTPDPTGAYYTYSYPLNSFPDYPKYSVWQGSYFVTANKSVAPHVYAMDRDKMLVGDPSASIQGFTIPQLTTNGFFSVLPAHASSNLPAANTPNYLYYFQDDGWGVATDHIKIWELDIDWVNTSNSSISNPQTLNVSPFDSEFTTGWDDIEQPGTSDRLDGIPTAFMYMAQYRDFPGYASVVLNHTVDVDGTNHSGIRWYELRKIGNNPWTVYQEGTFAPDAESRWLGSICMDYQGNIGLAYSISGPSVYPSIRYTGRYASDPLGQMTLAEEDIIVGSSAQTGVNRWGDYAQMTIDPSDDATFWYTGEYVSTGGNRKSRIASFKIANDALHDIGVVSIDTPNDGILTGAETISITVNNFGQNDQSNFPIAYSINGGTPVVETFGGTLTSNTSASFTFSATANMSTQGVYNIVAYTDLTNEQFYNNDTTFKAVQHLFSNDIGISAITSPTPTSNVGTNESITVTVNNYGATSQSGFNISYTVNGGANITEVYSNSLAAGANASYTFSTTSNMSNLGVYNLAAYTSLSGDSDLMNDTAHISVSHNICQPAGDCSLGDGFTAFNLGSINNTSSCGTNGYSDYTNMITDLYQGSTNNLGVKSGYSNQTVTVWIDFNDNFTFETNERVVINQHFGTSLVNVTLTIPSGAAMGEHLLRARTNWNSTGNSTIDDPCIDVSYGETEDYKVDIKQEGSNVGIGEQSLNKLQVLELGDGRFKVILKDINAVVALSVHNTIGQEVIYQSSIASNGNLEYIIDLNGKAKGYYLIKIGNENFSKVQKITLR